MFSCRVELLCIVMPALWGPQSEFALHILGKNLPPALLASRLFDLTGSTAMITGGAQGIGAAVALGMAHSGADIIIAGALAQWAVMSIGRAEVCSWQQAPAVWSSPGALQP